MSGRALIIADRVFDADHIQGGFTDSGGTNSLDYAAGREMRPATKTTTDRGQLNPTPGGSPYDDVAVDLILRTDGNTDGARWGHKDTSKTIYKGKNPAHILTDVSLLQTTTSAANRPSRPKLLATKGGALILFWVQGTTVNGGASIWYRVRNENGWDTATQITLNVALNSVLALDAVQMPDGEIVLIAMGDVTALTLVKLQRFTSPGDTLATIAWRPSPCASPVFSAPALQGMAIELVGAGSRIAMLIHSKNQNLQRTYSDDRGITWQPVKNAGQYAASGMGASATLNSPGGVSMARTRTGSLVALAPAIGAGFTAATGWTQNGNNPRLRVLVSDNGDNWSDMITASKGGSGVSTITSQADGLLEEGMCEGAIAMGDDGLIRIVGCIHGDPTGTTSTAFFDDLCLLTMRKADITAKDVGLQLTGNQAFAINAAGVADYCITCSDAFEASYDQASGAFYPTKAQLTLSRISCLNISAAGDGFGSGALDASPSFRGARTVDIVNWRGALWLVMATHDTDGTVYSLVAGRLNAWSELMELPPESTNTTKVLKGRPYTRGFLPGAKPERNGWTAVGAGTVTLDTATAGVKIDSAAATYYENANLGGNAARASFMRFNVKPTSGGSAAADYIAAQAQHSNGVDSAAASVRFTATAIYVVDYFGLGTLGSATGLDGSVGFEVVIAWADWQTLLAVFYRELATDPEENNWKQITLSTGALTPSLASTIEIVRFGNIGAAAVVSTWRNLQYVRGINGVSTLSNLLLQSMTSSIYSEFADDTDATVSGNIPSWDDGIRHGGRAPVCTSNPPQYLRTGAYVKWRGGPGYSQGIWSAASSNSFDISRIRRTPVGDFARSNSNADAFFTFDAGTDEPFRPDTIALFGLNCMVRVMMHTSDSWGTPDVNILCDVSDSADVRRDYFRRVTFFTVEGAGANVLRMTNDATQALSPHQFRSTNRLTWYAYSFALNTTFKILGNDDVRIFLDGDATGAGASSIGIFPDRIAFALAGGVLATTGYRYMRIQLIAGTAGGGLTSEGYLKLGFVIAGRQVPLSDPQPMYGYARRAEPAVSDMRMQSGYVDRRLLGDAPRSWSFNFTWLRDRPSRTNLSTAPGFRQGHQQLLDVIERLKHGEEVGAYLDGYQNSIADGGAAAFGLHTHQVFPVRISPTFQGRHVLYDGDGSVAGDQLSNDLVDVDGIALTEVL